MPKHNKVKLDTAILAELACIQDSTFGPPPFKHTDETDAILLQFWPVKHKKELAKWFSEKYGRVGVDNLRERYRKLTEAK